MIKEQLKICNELFSIANKQFENDILTVEEYHKTLLLIKCKLHELNKTTELTDNDQRTA